MGLGRITEQGLDLGRPEIARVYTNNYLADINMLGDLRIGDQRHGTGLVDTAARPFEADPQTPGGEVSKLPDRDLLASRDHEVLRRILLEHQPLHLDVVPRVAPVSKRVEVTKVEAGVEPAADARKRPSDLSCHEGLAASLGLVVEQYPVTGVHPVGLAIVDRNPVRVELRDRVGRPRIERCGLSLGGLLDQPVELRGRGLVETAAVGHPQEPDPLEEPQRADRVDVGRVFRGLKRDRDMRLCAEIVDLVGADFLQDTDQIRAVGQVAIVEVETPGRVVRVLVEMVDPSGVEARRAALDAVNLVALLEQ